MKHNYFFASVGAAVLIVFSSVATAAADAARGQTLYKTMCVACHSIDYNGVGPAHKGLIGKKAGSRADYVYSPAVKASSIVWADETLDKWLANPEKLIPGQKMGLMVPLAKDRADLIAYLKKEAK